MGEYKTKSLLSSIDVASLTAADYSYQDFIYSATLRKVSADGKVFNLAFGIKTEDDITSFYSLSVDFEGQEIRLGNEKMDEIKSVGYTLNDYVNYKVNLVVNAGVAKVYVNDSFSALLVLDLPGYEGGKIATNLEDSNLIGTKVSTMELNSLSGDYYVGGYTVNKVINLTDGNYRLTSEQYSIDGGVITIDEEYLKTLETATEYKFRAVTSLTDLDFYVKTEDVGTTVNSVIAKYYRGDDVRLELSQNTAVKQAFIDNEEVEFVQKDNLVTITSKNLSTVTSGEHNVKLFTANGRPETKFSLFEVVEVIPELTPPVNHTFFFVDIAIFAALILGYIGFSVIKKRAK